MNENEINVKFTSQTDELNRGILTAKGDLVGFKEELAGVARVADEATKSMTGLSTGGKGAAVAAEGMNGLSLATVGAKREVIVLAHEMVSGNFSRVPGSLMVLSERMGGINLKMLAMAGVAAEVAWQFGKMLISAEDSAESMNLIHNRLEMTGRGYLDNDKFINQLIGTLRQIPGVSRAAAQSLVADMAASGRLTSEQMIFMTQNVGKFAAAMGMDLPNALKELTGALTEPFSAYQKLSDQLRLLTPQQMQHIKDLESEGEKGKAAAIIQEALTERMKEFHTVITPMQEATNNLRTAWDDLNTSFANAQWIQNIVGKWLPEGLHLLDQWIERMDYMLHGTASFAEFKQEKADKKQVETLSFKGNGSNGAAENASNAIQNAKDTADARASTAEEVAKEQAKEAKEALDAHAQALSGMRTYDTQYYSGLATQIQLSAQGKKIGLNEEYAALQLNLSEQQAAVMKTFDTEMALYAKDSKEYAKLQREKTLATMEFANKRTDLEIKGQNAIDAANKKAADKASADWNKALTTINGTTDKMVNNLIRGTETMGQAFLHLAGDMVVSMAQAVARMAVDWVAAQAVKLGASLLTDAGILASDVSASKAAAYANIQASSGEAFAAAFASTCAIPIIGPLIAPGIAADSAAAADAGGMALASFDVGTPNVPRDMVAQIHAGEAIVPAKQAQAWRDGDLGLGGGKGGTPDVHLHVHTMDAKSVKTFFAQHGETVAKSMQAHFRNGGGRGGVLA